MNWYKIAQYSDINSIARSVLQLIGEAEKGAILNQNLIRNIVSKIPDETTLSNAINAASSFMGEMTPKKNSAIEAIWSAFRSQDKNSDNTDEAQQNEMAQEDLGAIKDIAQAITPEAPAA